VDFAIFPPSVSAPAAPDPLFPVRADGLEPLGVDEFASLIDIHCPLPARAPVAVAVSGGGDSMALALLADAWARATARVLHAVTVDHNLRTGSRAETEQVGVWLGARGIAHDILTWAEEKPATGIQEAARDARYRLICDWARMGGIAHVLIAHQLEDQAETFLMRLARGSGPSGLAAMRSVTERSGIRICRPLLTIAKARLRATLHRAGQDWIEDPSNEMMRFARPRYRRVIAALEQRKAGAERLAGLAVSFAKLDTLIGAAARRALGAGAIATADGVSVPRALYRALPDPVAVRVLRDVLATVGGRPLAPRAERLARARDRLMAFEAASFTLGGCRVQANRRHIRFRRELPRGKKPV
jgi:tRNA(Ile)-lysidine synthase